MGFIGSLFGGDSGNTGGAGMNYQASGPQQYQVDDAWKNTQAALGHQSSFINALNAQNQGVMPGQQNLMMQLQGMAAGQGPNPAQEQFKQNANSLAAQAAGLVGSQKGISPALQARLVAQQQAQAGQDISGQAAQLQAQQQMSAVGALQNQYSNMLGQQQNAMNSYQQGALGQQANVLGLQGNANTANAGVSQQVAGQQGGLFKSAGTALLGFSGGGQVPENGGPASEFGRLCMSRGGVVSGEELSAEMMPVPGKASVAGDSPKNDTVPARLSPGEIVIPRSIAQHPNAPDMAAKFVAAVMAKSGRLPK